MILKGTTLGHVASNIQTGPFGSQLHQSDYKPTGIPCIMPCNIGSNLNIICDNIAYISEEDLNRLAKHKTQEGDIVYSRRGDIEKCAYISSRESGWLCGTGCLKVSIDSTIALPKYVAYLLSTPESKAWLVGNAVGTTMLNLNTTVLSDFPICLPDLDTQQKVVEIIDSIADKIELNKRINDNLEQQAQALYKSWFVDFEPFKDGNFVESELGLIPEGWEVRDIYKYTDVIYGAPYKSSLFNENKEGYPLIRIRDLKSFAPQFYTQEILPQTEYIIAGDVVAGMDAEFTPYIWQGEKGVLNQRCCKFKGQYLWVSNYYLLNLLKPELEYVQSYKTGTTVSHLGKADIDRFKVITPPESIVKTFSVIVNSLLEQKIKSSYEIRNLTSTRDSLLPKLMSGELKINEIDC